MPSSPTRGNGSPSRFGGFLAGGMADGFRSLRTPQSKVQEEDDVTAITGIDRLNIDTGNNKENSVPGRRGNGAGAFGTMTQQRQPLSASDMAKVNDPKVQRLVNVSQMYFLDYYYDLMTYASERRKRLAKIKETVSALPEGEAAEKWKTYCGRERALVRKRRSKLKYGDFQILTQVGQGGYGQVYLARKNDTREVCALKVLNKKLLLKMDEIRHILTERDILTMSQSPWLVKLLYSFQDDKDVYLAMEFVPGGDFRTLLNSTGVLDSRHTRFYISEMFAAVDALHKIGYIHRDLKPENFLIDSSGHIKLTDFGLAFGSISKDVVDSMRARLDAVKDMPVIERSVTERQKLYRSLRQADVHYANSVVGSPDYMALEVLLGRHYDFTIDYWSLGCMLFETLVGYPPFAGKTTDETYTNLQQWKRALRRPQYEDGKYVFSERTWDLITRCIASPHRRFSGFEEIKRHPYFAEVDWDGLRDKARPPFVPQLDSETDPGYFDDFSNEQDMAKYKEVMDKKNHVEALSDRGAHVPNRAFVGFTYRHAKVQGNVLEETRRTARMMNMADSFATLF